VTSGKGRFFPRGIPVARASKVVKRELGRDQEVEAIPAVDFSRLDTVLVLTSTPGDETGSSSSNGAPAPAPRGRLP
jgi:rod shape-determining protein MreC